MDTIDKTDREILRLLQQDARLTTKELAFQLKLTTTPVYERVKKLEREGYIKGYVAQVNREKVGRQLMIFCNVVLKENTTLRMQKFEREIAVFEEVMECFKIAGNTDYLIKIIVPNIGEYQSFVTNKLGSLDNIARLTSSFVLSEAKNTSTIPIK